MTMVRLEFVHFSLFVPIKKKRGEAVQLCAAKIHAYKRVGRRKSACIRFLLLCRQCVRFAVHIQNYGV